MTSRPSNRSTDSPAVAGLDEVDFRLIAALQEDGRLPFRKLAEHVGVSESGARRRYKRLVDSGLLRVVGVADVVALGFVRAEIGVRVKGASVGDVALALAMLPEVDWVATCVGGVDIVVNVICTDHRRLVELIDRGVRTTPGVDSAETTLIVTVVKDDYRMLDIARQATRE
jgi:Lrp/AsnC family transcriptional regulator for asnA, asnC and gidA